MPKNFPEINRYVDVELLDWKLRVKNICEINRYFASPPFKKKSNKVWLVEKEKLGGEPWR